MHLQPNPRNKIQIFWEKLPPINLPNWVCVYTNRFIRSMLPRKLQKPISGIALNFSDQICFASVRVERRITRDKQNGRYKIEQLPTKEPRIKVTCNFAYVNLVGNRSFLRPDPRPDTNDEDEDDNGDDDGDDNDGDGFLCDWKRGENDFPISSFFLPPQIRRGLEHFQMHRWHSQPSVAVATRATHFKLIPRIDGSCFEGWLNQSATQSERGREIFCTSFAFEMTWLGHYAKWNQDPLGAIRGWVRRRRSPFRRTEIGTRSEWRNRKDPYRERMVAKNPE